MISPTAVTVVCTAVLVPSLLVQAQSVRRWKAHDLDRPKPAVVEPATTAGAPPADAIVLFDGTNLDHWSGPTGQRSGWTLRDGYMETAPGAGPIQTRRGFGDVQLHLEFATPAKAGGRGQGRGNSGVIIMGMYEVQVLDSYGNQTYADGQAASLYGQYPPMVNASRGPGQWQSYDIVFRRPRLAPDRSVRSPARVTVFHNGVLVQDAEPLWGPTDWLQHRTYAPHADALPLVLQDHDNPVRYRNIWVRPLPDITRPGGLASAAPQTSLAPEILRAYAGAYTNTDGAVASVSLRGDHLVLVMPGTPVRELTLVPLTKERFALLHTAGLVEFGRADSGRVTVRLQFAEIDRRGEKR